MDAIVARAKTFYDNGWKFFGRPDQITPFSLAEAGFECIGTDKVRCHGCKGILKNWDKHDIPMTEHRRHFPDCPFVKNWDMEILKSHESVKVALSLDIPFETIVKIVGNNPAILGKPAFRLYDACVTTSIVGNRKYPSVENEAERKRIAQEYAEGNHYDEPWSWRRVALR